MLKLVDAQSRDESLPHDYEVEQALLGAILVDNNRFAAASRHVSTDSFFEPLHGRIWTAIAAMVREGRGASHASLGAHFSLDVAMKELGGPAYLRNLTLMSPSVANAEDYARLIGQMATQRAVIAAADDMRAVAADPNPEWDAGQLTAECESILARVTTGSEVKSWRRMGAHLDELTSRIGSGDPIPKIASGLPDLDRLIGGFSPGDLSIIGGRPGMGKTAVAGQIAYNVGMRGKGVAILSMEMTGGDLALRMATAHLHLTHGVNIAYEAARNGKISDKEAEGLFFANGELRDLPILINETPGLRPTQIASEIRRLIAAAKNGGQAVDLVIIDHLQLLEADERRRDNSVREMTETTRSLKKLAMSLHLPIVALSQLNRGVEGRENKRPTLADLRESGSIEQDAAVVIFAYREGYYHKQKEPNKWTDPEGHNKWFSKWCEVKNAYELIVAKNRHGSDGTAYLYFDAPSSAIREMK